METSTTHTEAIAANVSRLLREAKITQRHVTVETGIPLTTLVRRLTGKTPFNVNELALIADLLEVPFADLVTTEVAA